MTKETYQTNHEIDSTEIIGNDDYRKSFKELDLEVTRIKCVMPNPDPFGLKVAIAINGHISDIFFFKMEKLIEFLLLLDNILIS